MTTNQNNQELMYNALLTQCEAEKAEALFTINNYIENSVGIGEHPQQVEEAMKGLEKPKTNYPSRNVSDPSLMK